MSFVKYEKDTDFPIENLPYGIFSTEDDDTPRIGVAIGDFVLDLKGVANVNLFEGIVAQVQEVFYSTVLNGFMALGRKYWQATRQQLQNLLAEDNYALQGDLRSKLLIPRSTIKMHLPAQIGDYTDFYSSIYHAANVGSIFRDPENPLTPNWRHLPIAYHGRSSSVVVSGNDVIRPCGQILEKGTDAPIFGPSQQLDFELEVAFFIGGPQTKIGTRVTIEEAEDHIFGFVLMNDWSARDIQRFEYVPLGPFLGKNFATSISPWVVTLEALEPFKTDNFPQNPKPLPYLRHLDRFNFDINITVDLKNENSMSTLCQSNFRYLYWTVKQQITHHTVSGCPIKPGDLMASGTISGKDFESFGSLLELSWNGAHPITLADGSTRTFLSNGDEVIVRGYAQNKTLRVGFGECCGKVLPASPVEKQG